MTILSLDIDKQYKHLCCYSLLTLFCTASLLTLFCTYCSYLLCGFHFLKNINYHDLASCVSDTFWPQVPDILMSWSGSNIFVLLQILLFFSSFKVIKRINIAILCRMQNPLFAKVALKETPLTYSHILNLPFTSHLYSYLPAPFSWFTGLWKWKWVSNYFLIYECTNDVFGNEIRILFVVDVIEG